MNHSIIGTEIDDKYRIEEVLGRGGMGVVYRAEEMELSRSVALKCLHPRLVDDESFLRRFRSEARAIARIDSPYIVEIYSLSQTKIGLVIVMEYVDGGTLKQRIDAGGIEWEESIPVIQQMLTALQHAHGTGVVHRDIKPQNILLSDIVLAHSLRVKMTDFGLAKINRTGDPNRTVTEGVYGTLYYMSPEQVEGHGQVDHRSDIYSLGMTCYEMLAGQLPFDEESSEYTIMSTIVDGEVPRLEEFAPDVPAPLRKAVTKAMARDPEERYQNAVEMIEELEAIEGIPEFTGVEQEVASIPADFSRPEKDESPTRAVEEASKQSSSSSFWQTVAGLSALAAVVVVVVALFVAPVLGGGQVTTSLTGLLGLQSAPPPMPKVPIVKTPDPDSMTIAGGELDLETTLRLDGRLRTGPGSESPESNEETGTGERETSEERAESRKQEQKEASDEGGGVSAEHPPVIRQLARIDSVQALRAEIDSLKSAGKLRGGDSTPEAPEEYYVFVEAIAGPQAETIVAVLSPSRQGTRTDIISGETVPSLEEYDSYKYVPRYVTPVQ